MEDLDIWVPPKFTVTFTSASIKVIQELSNIIKLHPSLFFLISGQNFLEESRLTDLFEQQFAMLIYNNIHIRNVYFPIFKCVIEPEDIIYEMNIFLYSYIFQEIFDPETNIQQMLDMYPISILANLSQTNYYNAHLIGEKVRSLISLGSSLQNFLLAMEGNVELVGAPKSPLNELELKDILRYLRTSRKAYVHILINCLFDFAEFDRLIRSKLLSLDEIKSALNSTWFQLF